MGAPKNRGYKRSWKNYLLNARYQLRFTLTMVGLCAVLMAGLGWWVLQHVKEANEISKDNIRGAECQQPVAVAPARPDRPAPTVVIDEPVDAVPPAPEPEPEAAPDEAEPTPDEAEPTPDEAEPTPDEAGDAEAPAADANGEAGAAPVPVEEERPERRPIVTITEPAVDNFIPVSATVRYHLCRRLQASAIDRIDEGRQQMLLVIVVASVLIAFGLGMWGIKMTHKVAGPLYKVTLYFDKMKGGKFDTVYNLRKGDQLVSFYDHFKEAHAGMKQVENSDTDLLRELITAADAAGVADKSPDIAATLDELRAVLKRKEEADG